VERSQVVGGQRGRGGKYLQRGDRRVELAIDGGRVHARSVHQAALDHGAVSREGLRNQDRRQHGAGQHRDQHQQQQIDTKRNGSSAHQPIG
jgi:hypothetical protein